MNTKKIFAAAIATLMAVSTMAVASFAEAEGTDTSAEETTVAQSVEGTTAETSEGTTAETAENTSASEEVSSSASNPGATTPDKNQPNTGVADIVVVAGLAAASAGVVVIAKKRK